MEQDGLDVGRIANRPADDPEDVSLNEPVTALDPLEGTSSRPVREELVDARKPGQACAQGSRGNAQLATG